MTSKEIKDVLLPVAILNIGVIPCVLCTPEHSPYFVIVTLFSSRIGDDSKLLSMSHILNRI